jgi:enoyl-CoA hydratase/carnithine racemase
MTTKTSYRKKGHLATLILNAPHKRHAFTIGMRKSLLSIAEDFAEDNTDYQSWFC